MIWGRFRILPGSDLNDPALRDQVSEALMKTTALILSLAIFAGCTVGPKYEPPENTISDHWQKNEEGIASDQPVTAWWTLFNDALLDKYIEMAAHNNKDLAQAEAAILQARALRDVAASKLFPQVTSDISAIKTYFSKNGPVYSTAPGGGAGGGVTNPTSGLPFSVQIPQVQNLFTALFDATWEIDLFGKNRRTVESAQAHVESAIEQRNGTLISILAEVARNYMELRGWQQQASYIEDNIQLLKQNAQIVHDQRQTGLANELDVQNIEVSACYRPIRAPGRYSCHLSFDLRSFPFDRKSARNPRG